MGAKSIVSHDSENMSGCMSHLILQGFNQFSVETWARCSYLDKTGAMCFFFLITHLKRRTKKRGMFLPKKMSFFFSLSSQLWWEQQDLHRGPSPFWSKPNLCLLAKFAFNSRTKMENVPLCWASCQSCCCMNPFCHESVVLVRNLTQNLFHLLPVLRAPCCVQRVHTGRLRSASCSVNCCSNAAAHSALPASERASERPAPPGRISEWSNDNVYYGAWYVIIKSRQKKRRPD